MHHLLHLASCCLTLCHSSSRRGRAASHSLLPLWISSLFFPLQHTDTFLCHLSALFSFICLFSCGVLSSASALPHLQIQSQHWCVSATADPLTSRCLTPFSCHVTGLNQKHGMNCAAISRVNISLPAAQVLTPWADNCDNGSLTNPLFTFDRWFSFWQCSIRTVTQSGFHYTITVTKGNHDNDIIVISIGKTRSQVFQSFLILCILVLILHTNTCVIARWAFAALHHIFYWCGSHTHTVWQIAKKPPHKCNKMSITSKKKHAVVHQGIESSSTTPKFTRNSHSIHTHEHEYQQKQAMLPYKPSSSQHPSHTV